MRVVELYCGIGGCATALAPLLAPRGKAEVVLAVDINTNALAVYRHNYPDHPTRAAAVESLTAGELTRLDADLWWLSPPCQPFTRRGKGRDADDPRASTFLTMIDRLAEVCPPSVALENVPGFLGSRVHRRLRDTLADAGYSVIERVLCPTELGLPSRRRRFYLVASRRGLGELPAPSPPNTAPTTLADWLEPDAAESAGHDAATIDLVSTGPASIDSDGTGPVRIDPALWVDPELLTRYDGALDLVRRDDPTACTACFTSAYGRSPVRSGSYRVVSTAEGPRVRRFAPQEILRLLGFPATYRWPAELPPRRGWPLVGNSLAIPAVRTMLSTIPGLGQLAVAPSVAVPTGAVG